MGRDDLHQSTGATGNISVRYIIDDGFAEMHCG